MIGYTILGNVNFDTVERFDISKNGIQVVENSEQVEVYNDPFRTIPLFIAKNKNSELIIFSNFEDFYKFENIDKTIDEAGFWEIVLFGSGLWTRTLYKNVEQMPSASKIVIDKNTNQYTIDRYWDFNIKEDTNIDSIEKAAKGLYDRLDGIFSKLDRNKKYVMGLSGGMDSRITLAFLSKYVPKENLKLFTFGYDENILEYRYAKEIAMTFGYDEPIFYKLTVSSYRNALDYMPKMTGGQIGINHCHMIDFFKSNNLDEYINISTYYTDAIFGYDCYSPKIADHDINPYLDNPHLYKLKNSIVSDISNDTEQIIAGYQTRSNNFSKIDEYKYLSERTPKFHIYLSKIQENYLKKSELLFANFDLLNFMLKTPIIYREQKKVVKCVLNSFFKENTKDRGNISSSDFHNASQLKNWNKSGLGIYGLLKFRSKNILSATLRFITRGHIQLFNKYQTEEQERLLYRDFHKDLKDATEKFAKLGLMTRQQKKQWDKLPLRSAGVSERYHLISLAQIVDA